MTDYFKAGFFCNPLGWAFSFSALGSDSWRGSGRDVLLTSKIFPLRSITGSDAVIRRGNYITNSKWWSSWISQKTTKIDPKVIKMKNTKTIKKDEISCTKVKFVHKKQGSSDHCEIFLSNIDCHGNNKFSEPQYTTPQIVSKVSSRLLKF